MSLSQIVSEDGITVIPFENGALELNDDSDKPGKLWYGQPIGRSLEINKGDDVSTCLIKKGLYFVMLKNLSNHMDDLSRFSYTLIDGLNSARATRNGGLVVRRDRYKNNGYTGTAKFSPNEVETIKEYLL